MIRESLPDPESRKNPPEVMQISPALKSCPSPESQQLCGMLENRGHRNLLLPAQVSCSVSQALKNPPENDQAV